MKTFNYKKDLKKLAKEKTLFEFCFRGSDERALGFLFSINDEYLVFGKISKDATFLGTTVCLSRELESLHTDTKLLQVFSSRQEIEQLAEEAFLCIKDAKEASFTGFLSAFQGTDTLVCLETVDKTAFTGKVVAHDDEVLVLDEYYLEDATRFSRMYIFLSLIDSITVGGTWLKINADALK